MVNELRNSESIDPKKSVLVAGDPEKKELEIRQAKGIPLMPNEINFLNDLSEKYEIDISQ